MDNSMGSGYPRDETRWHAQNRRVNSKTDMLLQCEKSRMIRAAGGSLYIWSRSVTSEGIPWAKAFSCERCTCFSKARFQGWGPTMRQGNMIASCISQSSNHVNHSLTRLRLEGSLKIHTERIRHVRVDTPPKLGEREGRPTSKNLNSTPLSQVRSK
ncbi:hypothetical protein TNCV_2431801 [Trichonephila clavipes]|nr:hypothetical protein TNCV_2431801 [Trichonephila clavipes]